MEGKNQEAVVIDGGLGRANAIGGEEVPRRSESIVRAKRVVEDLWLDPDGANPAVYHEITLEERAVLLELAFTGLNVPRQTASRVARWLQGYVGNYWLDDPRGAPSEVFGPLFKDDHNEMVVIKDLQFVGLCLHHLLPFRGHAAIGYVPNGVVMGLSKASRLVDYYCQAPTLQEHITTNVANAMMEALHPKGVGVMLYNVSHSCMSARGVTDPDASTTTSAVRGIFKDDIQARAEWLSHINR